MPVRVPNPSLKVRGLFNDAPALSRLEQPPETPDTVTHLQ